MKASETCDMSGRLTASVSEHVLVQKLGEDMVLLDLRAEEYYSLNSSGSHLWRLMTAHSEPFEWETVTQQVTALYDEQLDIDQLNADMQALLNELMSEGLLKVEVCKA